MGKHISSFLLPGPLANLCTKYCQVCEKQCRDENGFKCHTQSESHVRQMMLVGEDPRKYINDFSNQFQRDFLQQLRTAHGEKKVHMNHFYQEYISNKEHVHMNATRWPSLTEFAKHLGREGICRVEENEKGIHVSWIDNSPEALRRQDAIRKKERQDRGDEEREQKLIREQIERAEMDAEEKAREEGEERTRELQRQEGETIILNFGKPKTNTEAKPPQAVNEPDKEHARASDEGEQKSVSPPAGVPTPPPEKVTLKLAPTGKPKNVFATSKKHAFSGNKAAAKEVPKKPMSEAERIMKEEIERKRIREANGFAGLNAKRQRVA